MPQIDFRHADPSALGLLRHRILDEDVLVTNQVGQYAFLSVPDFQALVDGELDPTSDSHQTLTKLNFFRASADLVDLGRRQAKRKGFLAYGPNLHILVLTLRCNESCVYCHASRAPMATEGVDMTPEIADAALDRIFQTTSPWVTIEFQGGEPLANWPVLKHVVEGALARNKTAGKQVDFTLVSNLSLMDEEKLAFLLEHRVQVCTSIDGPRALHDGQRRLPEGSSFDVATDWLRRLNETYIAAGLDPNVYHVEALPTLTRESLEMPRGLVDTYASLGCRAIYLRPLDPFGFAAKTRDRIGYRVSDYLEFYRQALDYIIELNLAGEQMIERYAAIFLTKILSGEDPNFLDIRSPCGAGIGQVTYNHDGMAYVCDEARMLAEMGDDVFALGDVRETTYGDLVGHETVRAITVASQLDGHPDCHQCVYSPYCGICPVVNYQTQGSLHGQMRNSRWCGVHMGIQDDLFRRIRDADDATLEVFRRWVTIKPRDHYVHGAGEA